MEIVHNRLYRLDSQWYWEEEPISTAEGESLRDHYYGVVSDLARPWLTKDDCYDTMGRYNTGGLDGYED